MMRTAIYMGKQDVRLEERPMPVAGEHDIVVRNLYASICGTDVAVYKDGPETGHRITVGSEFGHEMVSEVVQVGQCVRDFKVGDRVYPYPLLAKGDPARAGTLGGFSEYMLLPDVMAGWQVYKVDDRIPTRMAALIEPFTVGCRAARRALPKKAESALVFGAGTIGLAAAIALRHFGCRQVLVVDRSALRLEIAETLGFFVCNSAHEGPGVAATRCFGAAHSLYGQTADVDIYIDAAGADGLLDTFQAMGKIGSRMVVVAVHGDMQPVDILSMTYAQQALIGSGGYFPEDVRDVMKIMASGCWDIERLITHEFPWEQLPEAIEQASRVDEALNVVIGY